MNKEPDSWITINGQHVPIFEGEGKREAVSRFLKGKSRVERNKDKYNTIAKFKKRKETNKLKDKEVNYKASKDGNSYEMDEEDRKKVMHKLGLDRDDKLKKEFEVSEDGTKFTMKPELREKYEKKLGLSKYRDLTQKEERNVAEDFAEHRRNALIKFTQQNKKQIDKWVENYDEETNKRAFQKARSGQGLTKEEYFGFLGSSPKPGSVIIEEFADGEDAVVANDGNWVRKSRIKEYNRNPKANQDAVYSEKDDEEWERLNEEQLDKISKFKKRKSSNK